jgi:hypothetical protein
MTAEPADLGQLTSAYTLSIDHQLALRAAARRLTEEFHGSYNSETVERFLAGSYAQFAASAKFPHYVHILAERFARQRLIAFAHVERHLDAGNPIVLFVCQDNDLYSPLARGLLATRGRDTVLAWSAGISPAVQIDPTAEHILNAAGIPTHDEFPKPIAPEMLQAATTIVTFDCAASVPVIEGRHYYDVDAPTLDRSSPTDIERLSTWIDAGMAELLDMLRAPSQSPSQSPSSSIPATATSP